MSATEIEIENFLHPSHEWKAKNDPVMGGRSKGTVVIENGVAIFDGEVVNVPFLQAPGFITMESEGIYPDVSSCSGLKLNLRASNANYRGYRISFGNVHVPGGRFAFGYKANFDAPVDSAGEVVIPFDNFTAKWDDATGDPIVTCQEDSSYCPTKASLQDLKNIKLWGEGVAGKVRLEISSISATGCFEQQKEEIYPQKVSREESAPSLAYVEEETIVPENGDEIPIDFFTKPLHKWEELNDPVMGGQSKGKVSFANGVAFFDGEVANVPFLDAPGFITMKTRGGHYPDVSSCSAMKLVLMATEEYHGYRVSFGTVHLPEGHHATGYKADFVAPIDEYDAIVIPFSDFTSKWDDFTGNPIVTCLQDAQYCPDAKTLQDMKTLSIWGEGVAGTVHLRIKSISAVGCSSASSLMTSANPNTTHSYLAGLPIIIVCLLGVVIGLAFVIRRGLNRPRDSYERVGAVINV